VCAEALRRPGPSVRQSVSQSAVAANPLIIAPAAAAAAPPPSTPTQSCVYVHAPEFPPPTQHHMCAVCRQAGSGQVSAIYGLVP